MNRKIGTIGLTLAGILSGCASTDVDNRVRAFLDQPVEVAKDDKSYDALSKVVEVAGSEKGLRFHPGTRKAGKLEDEEGVDYNPSDLLEPANDTIKKAVKAYDAFVERVLDDEVLTENELDEFVSYRSVMLRALENKTNPDYQSTLSRLHLKHLLAEADAVIQYAKAHPELRVYMGIAHEDGRDIGLTRGRKSGEINPQLVDLPWTTIRDTLGEDRWKELVGHFDEHKITKYQQGRARFKDKERDYWFIITQQEASDFVATDKVGADAMPSIPMYWDVWKDSLVGRALQGVHTGNYDLRGFKEKALYGGGTVPAVDHGKAISNPGKSTDF